MAGTLGKLPEFNPDGGNFEVFLERFETFASVNGISDDQKRKLFLTTIGEDVYVTLKSLLFPKTPIDASFLEVSSALKNHYSPRRSVVSERYRFNQRKQEPDETITDFIVAIREIAAQCEFGGFLQDALRDRLVAGLRTEAIRRRLLAMPDEEASWDRACRVAKEIEAETQEDVKYASPKNGSAGPSTSGANSPWKRPATSVKVETPRPPNPKVPKTVPPKVTKPATQTGGSQQQRVGVSASDVVLALMSPTEKSKSQPQQGRDVPDQTGFSCDQCNSSYKHESSLRAHVWSSHSTDGQNPFTCRICHQMCVNLDRLSAHIRTHTGERPFECPQCDERFAHQNTLRNHRLNFHLDSFGYICKKCNKGYESDRALEKHFQAVHGC
ncbi:uncharacterized protein LOC144142675 isoform X2 [Haemaphysalis longicornis]